MINNLSDIEESWRIILNNEFEKDYFIELNNFLINERMETIIFPKNKNIFNAFNLCPFTKIKIVVVGQDPYHQDNQADGLAFSTKNNIKTPPSLQNIFKEIKTDVNSEKKTNNLSNWATQGILLLNTVLTVQKNNPGSHQKRGWELFTNSIISKISEKKEGVIFMLWGRYAKNKITLIDKYKHYILTAAHPSPLSAYNGFFGCKHFSQANTILIQQNKNPINWQL